LYDLAKAAGNNHALLKTVNREACHRDARGVRQYLATVYPIATEIESSPTADEVDQKVNQQWTLVHSQTHAHHYQRVA
jgi:hypothetical protein